MPLHATFLTLLPGLWQCHWSMSLYGNTTSTIIILRPSVLEAIIYYYISMSKFLEIYQTHFWWVLLSLPLLSENYICGQVAYKIMFITHYQSWNLAHFIWCLYIMTKLVMFSGENIWFHKDVHNFNCFIYCTCMTWRFVISDHEFVLSGLHWILKTDYTAATSNNCIIIVQSNLH